MPSRTRIAVPMVVIMLLIFLVAAGPAAGQDVARANPKTITVKIDNERVRLLEAVIPPGYKEAPHSHPANIVYIIAGGTMRSHASDGTVSDHTFTAGEVLYREALTHWAENVGKTTVRLIIVELKRFSPRIRLRPAERKSPSHSLGRSAT